MTRTTKLSMHSAFLAIGLCVLLAWQHTPRSVSRNDVNVGQHRHDSTYVAVKKDIADAYRRLDVEGLDNIRESIDNRLSKNSDDYLLLYYKGLADYQKGFIYYIAPETREQSKQFFEKAIESLERSSKLNNKFSETYILLGNINGFRIGLDPSTAPILGLQADNHLAKAKELDSGNPRLHLVRAISTLYTPSSYGGGAEKAISQLLEAIHIWKSYKPSSPALPDWGYDEAYAWLIRVYLSLNQLEKAAQYIKEALQEDPENYYVREVLRPRLETKLKAKGAGQ